MKQSVKFAALIILAIAGGVLGLSRRGVAQTQATPTASPPSDSTAAASYLAWGPLGGPYERVAYALALVPDAEKSTLYMGTWGHGVYRSQLDHSKGDEGVWQERRTNGGRYINALAMLPFSDKALFAGTAGEGLWFSENGGRSWEQLGEYSTFTQVASPARTPLQIESLLLLAQGEQEKILVGTHNGVWASGALSDTWRQLDDGFVDVDAAYNVQALAYDPADWLYAGTLDGLYGSRDGGQTWQFLGPPDDSPDPARRILSLAVVTDTTNLTGTLLIGTQGQGLYALDVASRTWLTRTRGLPEHERARTIQALLSAPGGAVYAGTVDFGVFESADGGQTWQQRVEGLPFNTRSILSLAYDPTDRTLFAGTYGDGVYRLREGGQQWEPANTGHPVEFNVQAIAFAGAKSEHLYAGLRVGGLYLNANRYTDNPTWKRLSKVLPIGPARNVAGMAACGPDQATIVIAAATGIYRRAEQDGSWSQLGSEAGLPQGKVSVKALAQGRKNTAVLYAVLAEGEGIYRSDDDGATWRPARGDLDVVHTGAVSTLTVGDQDESVYLGLETGQVYRTDDAGVTWRQQSPVAQGLQELDWSQRTFQDVFLHSGPRRILYARATDGIYVSYDKGKSWQLRLRGFFSAMLSDPHRPWMVYVASPATTLEKGFELKKEFEAPIPLTPDLWISVDGGETWRWAGSGPTLPESAPASVATLAFDPQDAERIYAGTDSAGVFWAAIPSASRPLTPRAVIAMAALIVLLLVAGFILQTGWTRGRPYKLSPVTWPILAYLSLRHKDEMGLVSNPYTPLSSLERLTLACAPADAFRSQEMGNRLQDAGISAAPAQVETTLNRLASDYRLLRRSEGCYRLTSSWLGRIARARFWEATGERDRLIEAMRDESRLRAVTRQFFKLAGFDTVSFDTGFTITSTRPEYTLLGADQGIYMQLHAGGKADAAPVRQVQHNASRAYDGQLAGRIAFLVLSGAPHLEAIERITQLRQDQDFRLVLLSYNRLFRSAEAPSARRTLDDSLQRALGKRDLFRFKGPVLEPFDFFGREADLQMLVEACQTGHIIGLGGMAKIGKTSLAHQIETRLPGALCAWVDLDGHPTALYTAIRQNWVDEARTRFPAWEKPRLETLPERPTTEQIVADLDEIYTSLLDQNPSLHLVAVLDGLKGWGVSEQVQTLAQAVNKVPGVSLLGIFQGWPQEAAPFNMHALHPFEPETSAMMVHALALQMGLDFDREAQEQLHRASGGHPFLLRQLASLAVTSAGDKGTMITATAVKDATSRYVSQPTSALGLMWDALTREEQQALQSIIRSQPAPPRAVLEQLLELGWLNLVDEHWQLFSQVFERWLRADGPAQG